MDQICMPFNSPPNSVAIVHGHAEWFVRVIERGYQHTDSYGCETEAEKRAEGDRIRLHLKRIERL